MKFLKLNRKDPITIGSVVKTKLTTGKVIVGEVMNIITANNKERYELILYDKRLRPMFRIDGQSYKVKTVDSTRCKLIDENFVFDTKNIFEVGDVVAHKTNIRTKFGVIIGFHHPDGLFTTSYENGYNGTDIIDWVEINKRGLTRKKNFKGDIKRFAVLGDKLKKCTVDLWNRAGPKITV